MDVISWNLWIFTFYHQTFVTSDFLIKTKPVGDFRAVLPITQEFRPEDWEFRRIKQYPIKGWGVQNASDQEGKYPIFVTHRLSPKNKFIKLLTFNF